MEFRGHQKELFQKLKDAGFSSIALAKIIGTTKAQMSRYTNLDRELPKEHFEKLSSIAKLVEIPDHETIDWGRVGPQTSSKELLRKTILEDHDFTYIFINKKTWIEDCYGEADEWPFGNTDLLLLYGSSQETGQVPFDEAPSLMKAYQEYCSSIGEDFILK